MAGQRGRKTEESPKRTAEPTIVSRQCEGCGCFFRPLIVLCWLFGVAALIFVAILSDRQLEEAVSAVLGLQETRWFGMHPHETVLYEGNSQYQHIVVVEWQSAVSLFIDRFSQFSSREEHRYHESLVHPAIAARLQVLGAMQADALLDSPGLRILLLGAGDGLAAREVLSYGELISAVDLVDLDPHITSLFTNGSGRAIPALVELTKRSFSDPKMTVHHVDAGLFVRERRGVNPYDVIIVDLPDPMNGVLSDLYSVEFYREVLQCLHPGGFIVTQATGLLATKDAFWIIHATLQRAIELEASARDLAQQGWARPYKAYVPSWGEWGFVIGSVSAPSPQPGHWPLVATEKDQQHWHDGGSVNDPQCKENRNDAGASGLAYRFLNNDTVQALFLLSEDTLPHSQVLSTQESSCSPVEITPNMRGTGALYRVFSEAVSRESNLDPD